jgi:hypothetical protein
MRQFNTRCKNATKPQMSPDWAKGQLGYTGISEEEF